MRKVNFITLISKMESKDVLTVKEYIRQGMHFKSAIVTLGDKYFFDYGMSKDLYTSLAKKNISYQIVK